MRVCIDLLTGNLIGAQSGGETHPDPLIDDEEYALANLDTLKQEAINKGYVEEDIEVKFVTDEEYSVLRAIKTPEEAALAQQAKITVAIQNLLDTTAQQKDYDDIFTLISYVDDPDPIFNAEGQAAKLWRSEVWTTARQIKADVIAGTRPMPTVEEVLSEMPVFTWPE